MVTVKRKQKVDPKDIGGGWKPVVGKSCDDLRAALCKEEEKTRDPNLVTVKRKTNIDPNDIGGGWKPVYKGKVKEDNPTKNEPPPPNPYVDPAKPVKEAKDDKDIGEGWKPIGRVKVDPGFKIDLFDKTKVKAIATAKNYDPNKANQDEEPVVVSKKPPLAKSMDASNVASKKAPDSNKNKWMPVAKKVTSEYKHPNTWLDNQLLKTTGDLKPPKVSNVEAKPRRSSSKSRSKQASEQNSRVSQTANEEEEAEARPASSNKSAMKKNTAMITSTPNLSKREDMDELADEESGSKKNSLVDQSLDQSVIDKPEDTDRKPASRQNDEKDLNEKVMNDDDLDEMKEVKEERNNRSNEPVPKESTLKNDEPKEEDPEPEVHDDREEKAQGPEDEKKSLFGKIFKKDDEEEKEVNDEDVVEEEKEKREAESKEQKNSLFDKIFKKDDNEKSEKADDDDDDDDDGGKNQLWKSAVDSDEEE